MELVQIVSIVVA